MIREMAGSISIESLPRAALLTLLATLAACSGDSGTSAPVQQDEATACLLSDMFVPAGPDRANIVALNDPALVGATSPLAAYLAEDDRVIGINVNGEYLAIPHNILWSHEVVNLDFAGMPLAVTYSPHSGSSLVFDRRSVGGAEFGVADQMLYNNLVMFNHGPDGQAESMWSQMNRTAGCGPFEGQVLTMYPAIEMQWQGWLLLHPDTRVVSSDTGFSNDYQVYPYGDYENAFNFLTYFPHEEFDDRYAPKERVLGVAFPEGGGMAFPFRIFQSRGGQAVAHFVAGEEPTIVLWDGDVRGAAAYRATVNGQLLSFIREGRFFGGRFFDRETGSEWSFEGISIAGPLEGMRLTQVPESYVAFWFAWATFIPETFLLSGLQGENDALNAGKNNPWGDDPNHPENPLVLGDDAPGDIWKRLGASR